MTIMKYPEDFEDNKGVDLDDNNIDGMVQSKLLDELKDDEDDGMLFCGNIVVFVTNNDNDRQVFVCKVLKSSIIKPSKEDLIGMSDD